MQESDTEKAFRTAGPSEGVTYPAVEINEPAQRGTTRASSAVQSCAERAALGAGVPFAQAARFGAAAVMHLWAGRDANEMSDALAEPERLTALAHRVEQLVEGASLGRKRMVLRESPLPLLLSFVESTPCAVRVIKVQDGLEVSLHLGQPAEFTRPETVDVPDALWSRMSELSARADELGLPGGARLMGLE